MYLMYHIYYAELDPRNLNPSLMSCWRAFATEAYLLILSKLLCIPYTLISVLVGPIHLAQVGTSSRIHTDALKLSGSQAPSIPIERLLMTPELQPGICIMQSYSPLSHISDSANGCSQQKTQAIISKQYLYVVCAPQLALSLDSVSFGA